MKEFFGSMDTSHQLYWYIALIASAIFVVQSILTFIGSDTDTGTDADFDGNLDGADHPFQLFSLRNLINFFLGLGWTGAVLYNDIENKFILGALAFIVGLLFLSVFFFVLKMIMRLAEDNSFKIEDTVGKTADVYITIPANKQGKGRIQISVNGAVHEIDAMTDSDTILKSGSLVRVISIDGNVLLVESV